jgi:hypothetical protein
MREFVGVFLLLLSSDTVEERVQQVEEDAVALLCQCGDACPTKVMHDGIFSNNQLAPALSAFSSTRSSSSSSRRQSNLETPSLPSATAAVEPLLCTSELSTPK